MSVQASNSKVPDQLFYLRNALPEYRTFPVNMESNVLPDGGGDKQICTSKFSKSKNETKTLCTTTGKEKIKHPAIQALTWHHF